MVGSRAVGSETLDDTLVPLVDYALSMSKEGEIIVLSDRLIEALPDQDGQMQSSTIWYEAKKGRIHKVGYFDAYDHERPDYLTTMSREEFLKLCKENIDVAEMFHKRLTSFKREYGQRGTTDRDAYFRFF